MNFMPTFLDITDYMQRLSAMLNDGDCHVFIDTNILSQLYKLNDSARGEFFAWADSLGQRFHIPNWVVIEYNNRVRSRKLSDYADELSSIKTAKKELQRLQRFLRGYVDNDILQGSTYHDNKDGLYKDLDVIVESFVNIADAVTKKSSERLKKVEQDIKLRLDKYVVDTDIYSIMLSASQTESLRFENKVPPGFGDSPKESNRSGDLIIWQEILDCCRRNHWTKAVFVSRDGKDLYFTPEKQQKDGNIINNADGKKGVAHESLIYEFKIATGSSDVFVIDFITLVQLLSDNYTELAFSFQLVSRNMQDREVKDIDAFLLELFGDEPFEVEQPEIEIVEPDIDNNNAAEYQKEAICDRDFAGRCNDKSLKDCIDGLRTYNWYAQNDAIDNLRKLLGKEWPDTQDSKNAFFVIGRNILQSADGNAFNAVRFIKDLAEILNNKKPFLKKAIIDGLLFEVFFDSKGVIRTRAFKANYFSYVVEQAQESMGDEAFKFINDQLSKIHNRFVPVVGSNDEYKFVFGIQPPANEFDDYKTESLTINEIDSSATFMKPVPYIFAEKDEIKHRLSAYYAVPEDKIHIEGVPEGQKSLRYIKEINDDLV